MSYKLTRRVPKREGHYWLSILKKDGTPKKKYPTVVRVECDDRTHIGPYKVPKGSLIAIGVWSSMNPSRLYDNYRWSKRIEEPI